MYIPKKSLLVAAALWSAASFAGTVRNDYKIKSGPLKNLILETQGLKLDQEAVETSVQKPNPPSSVYLTGFAGYTKPSALVVQSSGHTVNYDFSSQQLPLITMQVNDYLFNKGGKWGWSGSIGYSYSQYNGDQKTALHLLPVNLNAVYRGEWKSTQKFIPYLMAGPANWIYFQRGLDEYNTSQAVWMGSAAAGIAVNLNHLGWIESRNDTEILLQFQRNFNLQNNNADFSGNTIELGGSLAL